MYKQFSVLLHSVSSLQNTVSLIFSASTIELLGCQLFTKSLLVLKNKINAIVKQLNPICLYDVQLFLGLCNYNRHFIGTFVKIALTITSLTCQDFAFVWSITFEGAFQQLKNRLVSAPILNVYNPQLCIELWINASFFSVGATLVQYDTMSNILIPIEYITYHLNSSE